jgi:hypothetical protein
MASNNSGMKWCVAIDILYIGGRPCSYEGLGCLQMPSLACCMERCGVVLQHNMQPRSYSVRSSA